MERVILGVRTGKSRFTISVFCADNMVVYDDVAVAKTFSGLSPVADLYRVVANFAGGKNGSQLHSLSPSSKFG